MIVQAGLITKFLLICSEKHNETKPILHFHFYYVLRLVPAAPFTVITKKYFYPVGDDVARPRYEY